MRVLVGRRGQGQDEGEAGRSGSRGKGGLQGTDELTSRYCLNNGYGTRVFPEGTITSMSQILPSHARVSDRRKGHSLRSAAIFAGRRG